MDTKAFFEAETETIRYASKLTKAMHVTKVSAQLLILKQTNVYYSLLKFGINVMVGSIYLDDSPTQANHFYDAVAKLYMWTVWKYWSCYTYPLVDPWSIVFDKTTPGAVFIELVLASSFSKTRLETEVLSY